MFLTDHLTLPEALWIEQQPVAAPAPSLFAWNDALAEALDLNMSAERATQIFGGQKLPGETRSVAQAYAGHQFGQFVPQLGDGRAVLLGERRTSAGERLDIQLKGSGRTPFSRGGDGKSALGPVVREFLVSEAMHSLGVPTTRALAALTTGERVLREQLNPGGVLVRVARSHWRVGTFEFLAARGEREAIAQLVDAVIDRLYPEAAQHETPVMALFEMIATAQAKLVAQWMALGFVHGVMNTDNTALSGQTIDYGPCAFLDEFHRDKVFSSIDRYGRYAYSQQPLIATWNLSRLGGCLMLLHDDQAGYESVLENFENVYLRYYHQQMAAKLGLDALDADDVTWLDEWLDHLQATQSDYTIRFRELADRVASPVPADPLLARWHQRVLRDGRSATDVARLLRASNPAVIPRNHQIQRAIVAADEGDFSLFHTLCEVFGQPFDLAPEHAEFAQPPTPEQRVTKTFCGT